MNRGNVRKGIMLLMPLHLNISIKQTSSSVETYTWSRVVCAYTRGHMSIAHRLCNQHLCCVSNFNSTGSPHAKRQHFFGQRFTSSLQHRRGQVNIWQPSTNQRKGRGGIAAGRFIFFYLLGLLVFEYDPRKWDLRTYEDRGPEAEDPTERTRSEWMAPMCPAPEKKIKEREPISEPLGANRMPVSAWPGFFSSR